MEQGEVEQGSAPERRRHLRQRPPAHPALEAPRRPWRARPVLDAARRGNDRDDVRSSFYLEDVATDQLSFAIDQVALKRLKTAAFALLNSLLPATFLRPVSLR